MRLWSDGAFILLYYFVVVYAGTSTPFAFHQLTSVCITLYPQYFPLLRIAKRCPPTPHDELHQRLFFKCRLADAGARRRWLPGPFDGHSLRASVCLWL